MHADLVKLLDLQAKDAAVAEVERRLDALRHETGALDQALNRAREGLEVAKRAAAEAARKRDELEAKIESYRVLQDRRQQRLEHVRNPKEASTLMAELDLARSVVAKEENDWVRSSDAVTQAQFKAAEEERNVAVVAEGQTPERDRLAARRTEIETEVGAAKATREASASRIDRDLRTRYERLRKARSGDIIVPLVGGSCGACHTFIPLNRRSQIRAGTILDGCEGCGAILYPPESREAGVTASATQAPILRWVVAPRPEQAVVDELAGRLHLPPALAALLLQRGQSNTDDARRYLRPAIGDLTDPNALAGMAEAVDAIASAVRAGGTIMVHGDYDVDGQCATAVLTRALRAAGAHVVPFVPHRLRDGYDFGPAGLAAARAAGASLVVTCDCGITAVDTVRDARAAGIGVIVTDHHLPGDELPPALAIVDPQRPDDTSGMGHLCGTGVAFKLVQALVPALGLPVNLPYYLLDMVALATVADVVPLIGENRILVKHGLRLLAESNWPGVRALVDCCGLGAGRDLACRPPRLHPGTPAQCRGADRRRGRWPAPPAQRRHGRGVQRWPGSSMG